jgi:hypothetical protein
LVERWATPWTEALKKKGFTPYQCNKLWAIAVVSSFVIAWTAVRHFALAWLT